MKKVLYVATVVKTHIMEFHIPYLKMFKEKGWETAVAAKNDYENPKECNIPFCDTYYNIPFERSPLKLSNWKAYKLLKKIIEEENYDIIHCHTPVGAMIARLASRRVRKKGTKVIYTAHGFHFYKGAPIINWLIYYPVEKILSNYTDVLITINQEDYSRAKKFHAKRVEYIPGVGIDLSKFTKGTNVNKNDKRLELGLNTNDFVVVSVGELIKRKNHETMIRGIANLKNTQVYESLKYLICGDGELRQYLQELVDDLGLHDKVHFLGYRHDIPEICSSADVFLFMSYQEGLPVALMEAMACGLPCICSNIRGNNDLIEDEKSGILIPIEEQAISNALLSLLMSEEDRITLGMKAQERILDFDISKIIQKMWLIYQM